VALRTAASSVLDTARKAAPPGTQFDDIGIELEDLSGQINVFEIMGPKSNQVLKGALSPVSQESREDFNKVRRVLRRFINLLYLHSSGRL
jgi:ribonuclease P/MRP protein subunit POP1